MQNIASYLLANTYTSMAPMANVADRVGGAGILAGLGIAVTIIYIVLIVLMLVSMWKVYAKAGKPGWAAIIPIYNIIVLLQIISRPVWWIILMFIPIVNIIFGLIVVYRTSIVFGKSLGFTLGLIFLPFIFYPILAFGSATYQTPVAPAQPVPAV